MCSAATSSKVRKGAPKGARGKRKQVFLLRSETEEKERHVIQVFIHNHSAKHSLCPSCPLGGKSAKVKKMPKICVFHLCLSVGSVSRMEGHSSKVPAGGRQ